MAKSFQGVWGAFEYLDEAAEAVKKLRESGRDVSVISPCPRHEFNEALGNPQSRIPFVTLIFGGLGLFFGYALPSWTAMDWVLPVSGKPIVGIPAFTIIGFELMVLLGGMSTAIAIFLMGFYSLWKEKLPKSDSFKNYPRFSIDRFGVVVRCKQDDAEAVAKVMQGYTVDVVEHEFGDEKEEVRVY